MVQYYTLEEAARILGMSADDLKKMAEKGEVRPFRDRGNMRFRTQEIDELARRRGRGSSIIEFEAGPTGPAPKSSPSPPPKKASDSDPKKVYDFTQDDSDQVEIGQELHSGSGSKRGSGSGKPGGPKSGKKSTGPNTPPPTPGSDSDVRLVVHGSDIDFQIAGPSGVKMVDDTPKSGKKGPGSSKSGKKPESGVRVEQGDQPRADSGVKMVGEGDDVPIGQQAPRTSSDSDIRLDLDDRDPGKAHKGPGSDHEMLLTEEIDLDAELRRAEETARANAPKSKARRKTQPPQLPTTSPFELSEADLGLPGPDAGKNPDGSAVFDLTPGVREDEDESSILSSGEIALDLPDSDVDLGESLGDVKPASGPSSGINLRDPADSGISLEESPTGDDIEFELSLDAEATPKPAPAGSGTDSSSEFELSLDEDDMPTPGAAVEASDSDSEFELTLDDSGGLAPLEDEATTAAKEEKDIFETDFEVPALDDESGSEVAAIDSEDTDLESSDFDLALGEEDIAADEESGSQVVALEDEEADDAAATVTTRRAGVALDDDEAVDEMLGGEAAEEEEEETVTRRAPAPAAAPASWGPLPAILLFPAVILLFLGGLIGFELVRGMWGYQNNKKIPGLLADPISRMFPGTEDWPPTDK